MLLENFSILYVEDSKTQRELIKDLLQNITKEIYLAENGKQGVELFSKYKPDIVINSSGTLGANNLKYQEVFNTNFGSNWEIIKFYTSKKITKKIKIILIGSTSYNKISKNYLLYSSSKAALHSLYKGSKKILKERKISLSIYHPKRMKTKMIKNLNFINKNSGINPKIEAKNIIKLI